MLTSSNRLQHASRAVNLTVIVFFALLFIPAAYGQTPDDFVHSLVQQKLILRHVGDKERTKVKKDKLRQLEGNCDRAVQIEKAAWDRGAVRVEFAIIGTFNMPPGNQCSTIAAAGQLEISGFARDERPDSLAASLAEVLQTPEQYLAAQNISFNLPPGPEEEVAVQAGPTVTPFKSLLNVSPAFSEEARKAKYQGVVVLRAVIGTDGRVHKAKVVRSVGMGLDEMALNLLSLWRFTPARQQDKPVACAMNIELSFNLY